ncbi:hypothetical protein [Tahibacter soli]|uniref:Uncharacterized protein n=1 Tax=Tahibacter soli TaxID=2983605 RepID=A0A9X3YHM0_9GAMM|nr:hypothetical protein [Tahibacter soli]MDC8010953.1 hypothetical protein [Tahibacter soli]
MSGFRTFLGQANLDDARQKLTTQDADGNLFRQLLRGEQMPWVNAFDEVDRLTLRGTRRLSWRRLSAEGWNAALAGRALQEVLPTLPVALQERMRNNLLDTTGRVWPVLMEWDVALFYLRRGFRLNWLDAQQRGSEFQCERDGLVFRVECKRITEAAKEKLSRRHAAMLGHGVIRALAAAGLCGDVVLDTPHENAPEEDEVVRLVSAALPEVLASGGVLDVQVAGVGHLTGAVQRIPAQPSAGIREHILRRIKAKPHDHRGFGAGVPLRSNAPAGAIVLWVRGPRYSPEQHASLIYRRVIEAADQLAADVPGVIFVDIEGIRDVSLFAETSFFGDAGTNAFGAHPSLAAIVWRTEQSVALEATGFSIGREAFGDRNTACAFPATNEIPLMDG